MALADTWDGDRGTWLNTSEFASGSETFTYAADGTTLTVTVVPVELTYSIFDPIQNVNFYVSTADFDGQTDPQPNDMITYIGNTYAILNIKAEHGVYLFSGIRQELRQ